jgi:hypothetical protein
MKSFLTAFLIAVSGLLFISTEIFAQQDGWQLFKKAKFRPAYPKAMKSNLFEADFGEELRAFHGKEVLLTGYVVPHEVGQNKCIILSSKPYAQCFFCGGAGPETIAEIYLKEGFKEFPQDKMLTVRGKLYLNTSDETHLYFWLKDAVIVK